MAAATLLATSGLSFASSDVAVIDNKNYAVIDTVKKRKDTFPKPVGLRKLI